MPETGDDRLRIADRLLTGLTDAGLAIEDICLDHLMMPFGVNQMPGAEVLETTHLVRARYPEFTSFPTSPMFHRDYRKDEFLIALLC